jgi:hypothetical protein
MIYHKLMSSGCEVAYGDNEGIVQTDQGEESGSVRENELNTRDLLGNEDTGGSNQLSSFDGVF